MKTIVRSTILAAAVALPGLAMAQPLGITVNPLTEVFALPGAIIRAPFQAFSPPPANVYNPAPALANAVKVTDDLYGVVPTPVLKATGPRYDNPAGSEGQPTVVLRPGSAVPAYVNTAPLRNVSVAGLAPDARYDFFVSPEQNTVIVDPASRRVVRVLR